MAGKIASHVLMEADVNRMTDIELEDCAEVLGSLTLPLAVKKAVWPRLAKVSIRNIGFINGKAYIKRLTYFTGLKMCIS